MICHSQYSDEKAEDKAEKMGNQLDDYRNGSYTFAGLSGFFILLATPFWVF
jgi:hypothetical protein